MKESRNECDTVSILHVDDDSAFCELVRTYLERIADHFTVRTATSVSEAFDRLADEPVDCIVSDYDMPSEDGLTLLEAVRTTHSDLPFILFTGKGSEGIASEAISAGVTDYLQKQSGRDQYEVLAHTINNAVDSFRAKERARAANRKLGRIFGRVTDAVVAVDGDWRYTYVNDEAERLLERPSVELIGSTPWKIFPELADTEIEAALRSAMERQETTSVVGYFPPLERWFDVRVYPDEAGVSIYFRDVTDEKESERELAFFNELVDEVGIGVGAYTADGTITYVNQAYADIVDQSRAELVGQPIWTLNPDLDPDRFDDYWDSFSEAETRISEAFHRKPDGDTIAVEVVTTCQSIQGTKYHFGTIRDVSDRHEEQGLLRQYETLVEGLDESVFMFDADGSCTLVNDATVDYLGVPRDVLISQPISKAPELDVFEDERQLEAVINAVTRMTKEPTSVSERTFELTLGDGDRTRVLDVRLSRVDTDDGTVLGAVGVAHDVTERHCRERELRAKTAAMDAATDGIAIIDESGRYTFVNDAFVSIFGYDCAAALRGEPWHACYDAHTIERRVAEIRSVVDESGCWRGEILGTRTDGTTVPAEVSLSSLPDGSRICVVRDVTERAEREREVERQTEHLRDFASLVSHDLRNPLSTAKGYLDIAMETGEQRYLEEIQFSLDRMDRIIGNVLWLARAGVEIESTELVRIDDALADAWSVVTTDSAAVELVIEDAPIGVVEAHYDRLCHLFENLLGNAVDHGEMPVTVRAEATDGGFAIEDDGPGIPPSERERVFDRGYSTRELGTGLGLYIVSDIVEAHGWSVELTSGADGGARFEFTVDTGGE